MKVLLLLAGCVALTGCSVFGQNNVESAPYTLLKADQTLQIEVRQYAPMVLVSAEMSDGGRNSAFRKLFRYISGENYGATEISMTAPVLMAGNAGIKPGTEISMTAPVFMGMQAGKSQMSFVMPKEFTLQNTPKPKDPTLQISELRNYQVAAIQFSGTLSAGNVAEHTQILQDWLKTQGYVAISPPVEAGYNGPMTLPPLRRNEILIEIQ